jgi:hypothetical protein
MSKMTFQNELQRALGRADIAHLKNVLRIYHDWDIAPNKDDYIAEHDEVCEWMDAPFDDPDKALSLIVLAAATYDELPFLGLVAAGSFEDLLRNPSPEMLQRIITEARKTPRVRWMLTGVWTWTMEDKEQQTEIDAIIGDWTEETPLPERPWA